MGTKTYPIVKGATVQCIATVKSGGSYYASKVSKGEFRKVDSVNGDRIRFSSYGDSFPKASFVGVSPTARLEAVVAAKKALVVKAQAAVADAEKALSAALNPPIKVGDKFRFASGTTAYVLKFKDDKHVFYVAVSNGNAYYGAPTIMSGTVKL